MSVLSSYEDEMDEDNVLNSGNEDLLKELKCLAHLDELRIEIKSVFALESLLSFHNLRGCTEQLLLLDFRETKVFNVSCLANMERLESLVVRKCESMEEMVMRKMENEFGEGRMIESSSLFPTNSNRIAPCFHVLSEVSLGGCNKLKNAAWLAFVSTLTKLVVMSCSRMEEIISDQVTNMVAIPNPSPFAKLEKLDLRDLPKLKSICWGALPFPCLRQIRVFNCSKLIKLPLNFDSGNQISIEGYQEWWEEIQWNDEVTRNAFLPSFKRVDWWKDVDWEDEAIIHPTLLFR
ncbi:Disease resistance protein family [Theobroma cacao]|uniref:Disease resistance protein family n=1 Tax=Theobroma cacao TaxID=3641 RepID=A0A061G9N1_THECC|nr:Disease resistance protein family [Theobroma cacao]